MVVQEGVQWVAISKPLVRELPNHALQATASSVHSCVAPASRRA
jgi:hypothetical protein